MTTLYNNRFILNYDYISKEWWYLSNQKQIRIKNQNRRELEYLIWNMEKQISGCVDDTRRL